MVKLAQCSIRGRVQMVMYRDFAQRQARLLGILGLARNEADGSVTIVAQGEEGALSRFIDLLHKGSFLSKVESVSVSWHPPREVFKDFHIIF